VQRFSVSVDDELEDWINEKAEERGVSKAKVIRDAIETARLTGLVRSEDIEPADAEPLLDRIERLETRVEALEAGQNYEDGVDSPRESVVSNFKRQLHGQPPKSDHGKEAVARVFTLLLSEGQLSTKYLKEQLFPEFESYYEDSDSMWQSIQRYFDEIPGIEKVGRGEWKADPDAVDDEVGGLSEFSQS
jgi:predicted transcriptional regulator